MMVFGSSLAVPPSSVFDMTDHLLADMVYRYDVFLSSQVAF